MVTVAISETYDLKTTPNKMSVLSVHTPDPAILKNAYPGLHLNYKFFKFEKCDIRIACASMLPADPLQVGTATGDIAPEDLFNPILYKAISTEGMSNLEKRLMAMTNGDIGGNDIDGQSLDGSTDFFANAGTDFQRYYALLSNPSGWKMANPQAGLRMDGLYPLVYETWNNLGDTAEYPAVNESGTEVTTPGQMTVRSFRGSAHKMPRVPTTVYTGTQVTAGLAGLVAGNAQADLPQLPTIPVACIIMPPSKLHSLYYRMVIRWYVTYSEVRPLSDVATFEGLAYISGTTYGSDYTYAKDASDAQRTDMVDSTGVDSITKVMSTGL